MNVGIAMPPRPRWWHTLQESRRQACSAIDFYNRPGDKGSYLDFVVHMHLAWQNLLHADFEKSGIDFTHKGKDGKVLKTKDGDKKTWELMRCAEEAYEEHDPIRKNIEFFVGIRNKIEHRFQKSLIIATGARAHALVINFESELVRRFGPEFSLSSELRFPVFVQSLTPEGVEEQRKLRNKLPAAVKSYITRFEAKLDEAVKDSERYEYRVLLTPLKGPKSDADLAVTFLKADSLTDEEREDLTARSRTGTVIITEKQRDIYLKDALSPAKACAAIAERLPFVFQQHHFTAMWKKHGVRPPASDLNRARTDTSYCLYNMAHDNYVFTKAYIDRCVKEIDTREKFISFFGKEPALK
ncbi:DUF3644 domain-containing protein [Streptomyces sp. NPDC059690]|uniref:DUF3644 domain-containing protein n=1 Tax=Streptomyces sp. NPDC059690 TaxID=3346907 RepID=UPI0036850AA5